MRRSVAFLALFLTLVTLGCLIVSIIFPWYRVKNSTILTPDDYEQTLYYWNEIKVTNDNFNVSTLVNKDGESYDDLGYDHIKNVFIVSLAFTCLATLLTAITILFVFIAFIARSRVFGIISGIFMFLVLALTLVAFFQFLRVNRAFREDLEFCKIGDTLGFNLDNTHCHKFLGNNEGKLVKINYSPYVGWWVSLGAVFLSGLSSFILFSTSRHHNHE